MVTFDFTIPSHLKFGIDVINRIGNLTKEFGDKVILVTEGILHESGVIKRVVDIIEKKGSQVIIFDEIVPNAKSDLVDYGAEIARSSYVNVVVGLGGIRTLSIAKAIAMLASNKGNILDYIQGEMALKEPLPYIEVPSTPRNPFMFRNDLWIVNALNNETMILELAQNPTKYILFDPMITTTLPRRFTATTVVYALSNAIEGYISTKSNFVSDLFFLHAIRQFNENIFKAVNIPDEINARALLGLGGLLTSLGLSMSSTGIAEAVAFVLSSKYRIHKSLSISVLLPHVIDFNITSVPIKLVKISEALGENITNVTTVDAALKVTENIRKMIIKLQLPVRLKEFDLNKDDLITIADDARKLKMFNYIPRSCSSEELYQILLSAY